MWHHLFSERANGNQLRLESCRKHCAIINEWGDYGVLTTCERANSIEILNGKSQCVAWEHDNLSCCMSTQNRVNVIHKMKTNRFASAVILYECSWNRDVVTSGFITIDAAAAKQGGDGVGWWVDETLFVCVGLCFSFFGLCLEIEYECNIHTPSLVRESTKAKPNRKTKTNFESIQQIRCS